MNIFNHLHWVRHARKQQNYTMMFLFWYAPSFQSKQHESLKLTQYFIKCQRANQLTGFYMMAQLWRLMSYETLLLLVFPAGVPSKYQRFQLCFIEMYISDIESGSNCRSLITLFHSFSMSTTEPYSEPCHVR